MAARFTPARLRPLAQPLFRRTMASSAKKFEFLVVVPDKPGMLQKRLEVRPIHFAELDTRYQPGDLKMGGALLDDVPEKDEPSSWSFAGSTLVCLATSRQEVLEKLQDDIYAKTGVWDMDKAQIYLFKPAFDAFKSV